MPYYPGAKANVTLDNVVSATINPGKATTGSLNISGKDDTNLMFIDYANNQVKFNTTTNDGNSKYWFAGGVTRFDENFLFRKGSGEQVIARQNSSGGGATGYDLKFESGNVGVLYLRGDGYAELGAKTKIDNITAPSDTPTGGGYLYAEGGALKWRGSSGTVTVLGVA